MESFTNFAFKTILWLTLFFYSMLSVNSKIGRFVKLILFAELVLPCWLRHILYNELDSLPPVIEVMSFIPTWPTIKWRMFNIPMRMLVSTYMLIASAWKLIAFEYENKESRESNNHTKRSNWSSFKVGDKSLIIHKSAYHLFSLLVSERGLSALQTRKTFGKIQSGNYRFLIPVIRVTPHNRTYLLHWASHFYATQ